MAAWLAALYLLCHGLALALLPGHAQVLSFSFLIGAPLLAALACLWRMRLSEARVGWLALAVGMAMWAGGMALTMYEEVGRGNPDATPGASMLLYVLYGVPLTFAMAHPRHEPWYLLVIDGALALLLGYLFFVHTFSFATMSDAAAQGVNGLRLMFDIENLFIAAFALVRYLASEDGSRRVFFRALAVFAWLYLVMAAYINHFATDASYGGLADVLIDLPFLLLALLALRGGAEVEDTTPRRLALAVRAGSPLILPASAAGGVGIDGGTASPPGSGRLRIGHAGVGPARGGDAGTCDGASGPAGRTVAGGRADRGGQPPPVRPCFWS